MLDSESQSRQNRAGMPSLELRKILPEIHHLLWSPPEPLVERLAPSEGLTTASVFPDGGWNCRDHTFVSIFLALMQGLEARAVHGRLWLIDPPATPAFDGKVIQVHPHSWMQVKGRGIFDLSLRLDNQVLPSSWEPWPVQAILDNDAFPPMSAQLATLEHVEAFAQAQQFAGEHYVRLLAYLPEAAQMPNARALDQWATFIHSPFSDQVSERFPRDDEIYAKAILHLSGVLERSRHSLRAVPQWEAWEQIAKLPTGAIATVLDKCNFGESSS